MSEDEFDAIPDEFSNIQGVDWAALLSAPAISSGASNGIRSSPPPTAISQPGRHFELQDELSMESSLTESDSRSSMYFSDPGNMDSAFLAELDRVEQQILLGLPPSASAAQTSAVDEVTATQLSSRNGKAKASEVQDIISAYEDELTCPICCDLLVAAHVGNPCGHTFCGECGWQWHVEKSNKACPCCRQTLDKSVPMIPNIAIDNTVEKHVKALAISGASEWESDGRRYMEWNSRKKSWQQGAKNRKKRRVSPDRDLGGSWFPVEIRDPADDWFQDSDAELIPRRMRRRRRQQVPGTTIIHSLLDLV